RCILDTQGVGKEGQDINTPLFAAIASRSQSGALINLQTASPAAMGNPPKQPPDMTIWVNTFTLAHQMGTHGLEVWSEKNFDGVDNMTTAQLCSLLNILTPGQAPNPPCQ